MSLNGRLINVGGTAAVACTTDSVQAFGPDNAYSTNWALYQLDGNANDTTGNYNGTASNVTYSTGEFGQAAVFNGSSSYITLGSTTPLSNFDWFPTGGQTISAWIYPTAAVQQGIIGFGNDSTLQFNYLRMNSDRTLTFLLKDGSIGPAVTTVGLVNLNAWNYVCVTVDFNNVTFYINGGAGEAFYSGFDYLFSFESVDIGRRGGSADEYFNGSIDQIRLFDEAISEEEVATLYAETTSTASNPNPFGEGPGVALYTLDYDASDAGELYNGTPTNVDFGVGGHINYGAGFNGISSRIDLPNVLSGFTNVYSFSIWVKINNVDNFPFFGTDPTSSSASNILRFALHQNGNYYFDFGNSTSARMTGITPSEWRDNNWHNFVFVSTPTQKLVYVDGSLFNTLSSTGYLSGKSNLTVGHYLTNYGEGTYDQFRIFYSTLDQSQVDILYAETACVYTCTTDTVDYPTTNVAYYKLDNTAEDETGTYDGTATNVNYTFGRFGQAGEFNGSSSKITTNANFDGSTAQGGSISFWFKTSSTASQIPIGSQTSLNGSAYGSNFYVGQSTGTFPDESLAFWHYDGGSVYAIFVREGHTAYQNGNWFHCVMTSTSTTKNIYINGVDKTLSYRSGTTSSTPFYLTNIQLGISLGSGEFWDGSIDQVRIFSSALTSTQVTELYEEYECEDTSTFQTVLYTGNGTTQYVSNVGFQPDFVWTKNRSSAGENHQTTDIVSGFGKALYPNLTNAQVGSDDTYYTEKANGFTINTANNNASNNNYVAWCWKGGDAAVLNTDGSITSTVSANQAAGFSIVSYTGNGSSGATVGHGLSQEPELIIPKNRDAALSWIVGATPIGKSYVLDLANPNPKLLRPNQYYYDWNSTTITMGSEAHINGLNNKIIAYCFYSVDGYQKVGSFNQASGTTTVSTGFEPRFLIIKRTDNTGNWMIFDYLRSNGDAVLYANLPTEEQPTAGFTMAFNNDGFVLTIPAGSYNVDYIYLAIGEEGIAPAVIPTDSLLGLFEFDENLNDSTGQGNLISNATTYSTGKFGQAIDMSASVATMSRTSTTYGSILTGITSTAQSYSVSIWFKLALLGRRNILWYVDRLIGPTSIEFSNNVANSQTQMYVPAPISSFVGPFLNTSAWYNFTSTYNASGTITTHYLDGVEMFKGVLNTSNFSTDCFSHAAASVGFRGYIDRSRFYSRVLTPAEVLAIAQE
jgi:hypothetical protein